MRKSRDKNLYGYPALLAALALAASATDASAALVEVTWSTSGRFERSVSVEAGKAVEVCAKLGSGTQVRWEFDASTPMDFNVHYHADKDVVFPSRLTAVSTAQDTLDAKSEQHYCWKWSNKSAAPATVMVKLQR